MKIDVSSVGFDWLRSLRLDRGLEGIPRNESLQLLVSKVPDISWRIVHMIAPAGSGLWFLKAYRSYADDVSRALDPTLSPELVDRFKKQLRKLRIPVRSLHAAFCFGIAGSPLGGLLYSDIGCDPRMVRRYESFFAPEACGDALVDYFIDQAKQFGIDSVCQAADDEVLFNCKHPPTEDFTALCLSPALMSAAEAAGLQAKLEAILSGEAGVQAFAARLEAGVKFAGAIGVSKNSARLLLANRSDGSDLEPYVDAITANRITLARQWAWPHMLEYCLDAWAGWGEQTPAREDFRRLLDRWPVVNTSPFRSA